MATSDSSAGFTLIELLVVLGITAILSAMIAGYSRESSHGLALASTQAKMTSLISRAKFLSIETYFGGGRSGDQRICAYGVRVDRSGGGVFIFQDLSTEAKCPGNSNAAYDKGERLSGEINEVVLKGTLVSLGDGTNLEELVFIPPDPQTKINKGSVSEGKIEVKAKNDKGKFIITVNNAGQIKAE